MDNYDITEQIEPNRKSVLDIMRENLSLANKHTFVHRLIYIGKHTFHTTGKFGIGRCMERTIMKVNNEYNDEPLTGVLLIYPKHFCHLLEGSEDSLNKHFQIITTIEQYAKRLGRMKLIMLYHHCNQRFANEWIAVSATPPTFIGKLTPRAKRKSSKFIYYCIVYIYRLATILSPKVKRTTIGELSEVDDFKSKQQKDEEEETASKSPLPDISKLIDRPKSPKRFATGTHVVEGKTKNKLETILKKYPGYLPPLVLLDFLIRSHRTGRLEDYIATHGALKPVDHITDHVWPVPTEVMPHNIFEKPTDPVPELPDIFKPAVV